jgi:hypothetical protein
MTRYGIAVARFMTGHRKPAKVSRVRCVCGTLKAVLLLGIVVTTASESTPQTSESHATEKPMALATVFQIEPRHASTEIGDWIRDLDSDEFCVREGASSKLLGAGKKALDALATATEGQSLESTLRAFAVLKELSGASDTATAEAAQTVLGKLATSSYPDVAQRARVALQDFQKRIFQELQQLGGGVHIAEDRTVAVYLDSVVALDKALPLMRKIPDLVYISLSNPRMNDALMSELKDLPKLRELNLYRSGIGDDSLKHFGTLPSLRSIPMGETLVSDAGFSEV